jgi:hypothetical protein
MVTAYNGRFAPLPALTWHFQTVEVLLQHGASVAAQGEVGNIILHCHLAAFSGVVVGARLTYCLFTVRT